MNARIRPGSAVDCGAMGTRRKSAKAKAKKPRRLRGVAGTPDREFEGTPRGSYERSIENGHTSVQVRSDAPDPYRALELRDDDGDYDVVALAKALHHRLGHFIKVGSGRLNRKGEPEGPERFAGEREDIFPVLRAYADALQASRARDIASGLMEHAARMAGGLLTPEQALAQAKALRGQPFWVVENTNKGPDDAPEIRVTSDRLREVIDGPGEERSKTVKLYRYLAEGSEADPYPQDNIDGGRAEDLRDLVDVALAGVHSYKRHRGL